MNEPLPLTPIASTPDPVAAPSLEQVLISEPAIGDLAAEPVPEEISPQEQLASPGVSISKPDQIMSVESAKPKQAAARLIAPVQQLADPFPVNPWVGGLVFLGVFGLMAGFVISRRLVQGSVVS